MRSPIPLRSRFLVCLTIVALLRAGTVSAQSIAIPWSGHGHDPQHTGVSVNASQPLNRILWQTPVDLYPTYAANGDLYSHYGSPLVTRAGTVLVPVKTSSAGDFRIEAHASASGALIWSQGTDYIVPSHAWFPSCGLALTPKNRLFFPGAGGSVYFRDAPDAASAPAGGSGQIVFYGLSTYAANTTLYNNAVQICTPITSDRYGNIFFGYTISQPNPTLPTGGIARISVDGAAVWITAAAASTDSNMKKPALNCAPALSNDQLTLYVAVNGVSNGSGYLLALNSETLAAKNRVRMKDVLTPANDATLPDDSSGAPMVGPDGDVYYGVLESNWGANHLRGWMLHYDATLSTTKTPGSFGWDDTASVVPAKLVTSYGGSSSYLILTKYNNYADTGGNGANKIAVLDPNATEKDPVSGATVMKEVITQLGPTPDPDFPSTPGAVREWCVNTVAVDPATASAIVHSEDGCIYRWNFSDNTLTQKLTLTAALGTAYTPSVIGPDGTCYAIANATLFAVGQ